MQSNPSGLITKTSSNESSDHERNRQYGLNIQDEYGSSLLHSGAILGKYARSTVATGSAVSTAAISVDTVDENMQRLSLTSSLQQYAEFPVDRISEHEKALENTRNWRNEAPGFVVVPGVTIDIPHKTSITDFPNEVLTHILSHLPPSSLTDASLLSKRFHALVTLPHAWRMAFARFFPGAESLIRTSQAAAVSDAEKLGYSERRAFTRLTALASWRTEYIIRTLMLRSLSRGKPFPVTGPHEHGSPRYDCTQSMNGQITYDSKLNSTVSHIHGTFGSEVDKKPPRFIHGAREAGSSSISDPRFARIDRWGNADPQEFSQFIDEFPGDSEYGLGAGNVVGVPNSMSVSQPYGMVYAEGFPGGSVYYRSAEEQRGRTLTSSQGIAIPELGIPNFSDPETICSVWIAKNSNVPEISKGLIGILTGSSHGVVSSYSLGTKSLSESRIERGELTARWMLSPGVPVIAIAVDEDYSLKRMASHRIWAVVLNALGEVFYLTDTPWRSSEPMTRKDEQHMNQLAWETGRSVYWILVEATRRTARPDPFKEIGVGGSIFPRSSWAGMSLSKAQVAAETLEIEAFANQKPVHFRRICDGWDMRRRLEVDFAAGDETGTCEGIVVISCGLNEEKPAYIKRFTRLILDDPLDSMANINVPHNLNEMSMGNKNTPSFAAGSPSSVRQVELPFEEVRSARRSSVVSFGSPDTNAIQEWRTSALLFHGSKTAQISATTLDCSTFARLTFFEDPLLSVTGSSTSSSPSSSPGGRMSYPNSSSEMPGQRARLMAAGTQSGTVMLWNIRGKGPDNKALEGIINPIRVIHTDSPQISSLGLSALYLVHGGNDGLVQAWDPLASSLEPVRTLNSRYSSRARRRLVETEFSQRSGSSSSFAAAAICLDPDPTVLRGIVSLGKHLRYWSYTSSGAEQYKSTKRKLRRSTRRNNHGSDRFSSTGRGALQDYIITEKLELEEEKKGKRRERERLASRFGLNLLGPEASEEEILAYATLLSQEAAVNDEERRESSGKSALGKESPREQIQGVDSSTATEDDIDADVAEAIRLSLRYKTATETSAPESSSLPYSIRYSKRRKSSIASSPITSPIKGCHVGDVSSVAVDDLDFAIKQSFVDERERKEKGEVRETI